MLNRAWFSAAVLRSNGIYVHRPCSSIVASIFANKTRFPLLNCKFSTSDVRIDASNSSKKATASTSTEVKVDLKKPKIDCSDPLTEEDDEEEMVEMFANGPSGMEWNGPTRGGRPEPTRYGDWEKKGRISDF